MHLFQVAFFCSGALYALLEAPSLLLYFFAVIGIYFSFSILLPGGEKLSNRAKLISSSWADTQDNSIFLKLPIRVEKVESIIKKSYLSGKKEPKLSVTHFVIKACGEVIRHAQDINGSYAFGRVKFFLYSFTRINKSISRVTSISEVANSWLRRQSSIPIKKVFEKLLSS